MVNVFVIFSIVSLVLALIFLVAGHHLYFLSLVLFIVWILCFIAYYSIVENKIITQEREDRYRREKELKVASAHRSRKENSRHYMHTQSGTEALKVLKIKYVNGEISKEKYNKLKKELEGME